MKNWWTLILAVLMVTACSKDDTADAPTLPARRTVIVYMSAENDLSAYGFENYDINELKIGRKSVADNENLVIFVDRPSTKENPFLAKVTKSGTLDTLYRYEHDFYASDPKMMAEVLNRAITLCPATEDYGLVLWGHASGWIIESDSVAATKAASRRAYGRDTGDNTPGSNGKWLNIPSLKTCLWQIPVHWKFIFCDCCNMANIETAYELRSTTDYLIGSPSEIPGDGAPYNTIVKDLFNHDDKQMYTNLCDDYYAQTDSYGNKTPLAVLKMSELEKLVTVTKEMLQKINDYVKAEESTTGIIYYYAYDKSIEADKTLYDMNDMVKAALSDDAESYQRWREAFDQVVIYKKMSTNWLANHVKFSDFKVTEEKFGGVSMFFPMQKYASTTHQYNENIAKLSWYYAVGWSDVGW